MNTIKKIGILGGTFDPPHVGHLKLATHFAKLLSLDALLLIPSGEPWQKGSSITPADIRLQLTEAAGIDLARAFLYKPRWGWEAAAALGGTVNANERYWRCLPREAQTVFGDVKVGQR